MLIVHCSFLILTSCVPQPPNHLTTQPPNHPTTLPTPTLLGTVAPPTRIQPSATPQPDSCIFRTDPATEIGVYRFDWDNATFTIETKLGPIIIDGPRTLTPGPRRLILLHNADIPPSFGVAINFDVGGVLIHDLSTGTQETRDAGGTTLIQTLADPVGDANGLPPYLDITRVERNFGYYPNSTVRVFLAGVRDAPQIWTFQSMAVSLDGQTYTRQSFADGRVNLTVADSQGRVKDWPGPVSIERNIVAFSLQTGVDEAVSAATFTSGGDGDTAGPYPKAAMQKVWEAVKEFCP